MSLRRRMIWGLAIVFTIAGPFTAAAQGRRGAVPEPYTPAADAKHSIAFTYTTWLGRGGLFHSDQMHVVERFTRQGDVLLYDVTVEDPGVLVEPWVLRTRTVVRNSNPDAGLIRERGNCEVQELGHATSQIRH